MFSHIPEIVHGLDVATASTKDNAFPVSISISTFDVVSLRLLGCSSVFARTDDNSAKNCFDFSDGTIAWWKGNSPTSPPKEAYELTYKDANAVYIPDALQTISDYLGKYWRKNNQTLASKTPTFDTAVLINACNVCNKSMPIISMPTLIDSAHTALRSMLYMGFEPNLSVESASWKHGRELIEHYAPDESGIAGYITARHYHLLYLARHDMELAKEAHDLMIQGKYDYIEFSVRHKDKLIPGE